MYSDEFISPDKENDWIRIRDVLRPHCIGEEGSAGPDMARGSLGQEADEGARIRDQHRTIR